MSESWRPFLRFVLCITGLVALIIVLLAVTAFWPSAPVYSVDVLMMSPPKRSLDPRIIVALMFFALLVLSPLAAATFLRQRAAVIKAEAARTRAEKPRQLPQLPPVLREYRHQPRPQYRPEPQPRQAARRPVSSTIYEADYDTIG